MPNYEVHQKPVKLWRVLMLVAGAGQMFSLLSAGRIISLSPMMYIVPFMLVVAGIVVLCNPFQVASLPFLVIGIGTIVAALSDIINTLYIYFRKKRISAGNGAVEVTVDGGEE